MTDKIAFTKLLELMSGFEAEQEWRYTAAHGLVFGGGVAVRFTQRTRWTIENAA